MRISHKYKFIFLANTQSGSSSIRSLLDPYSDIKSGTEFPYHHHTNARRLKAHFQDQGWNWDEYFKFTTIRNPWDKMVGRYHYGLKNPNSIWHIPAKKSKNFKEFIYNPDIVKRSFGSRIDMFAFGEDGKCLVDHIVKLEEINTSLPFILEKLGIVDRKIPRKNKSSHKHYSCYYDEETKNKVQEMFDFDIEYGQYKYEKKNALIEELKALYNKIKLHR